MVVAGGIIVRNLLASFDEASTGWTGTCTGTTIVAGNLQLAGSGNILDSGNLLAESDLLDFGGLGNSGTYEVPLIHRIDTQRVVDVGIAISWSAEGVSIYDNFIVIANVIAASDILGTENGPIISVRPRIQVAQADGVFGSWQDFSPGRYTGQYFNFSLAISTTDPAINCVVSDFSVMTDVPDRVDTGTNVSVSNGGLTITYASPFNITPNVQVTILSASPGDDAIVTKTTGGFTVYIVNIGTNVARSIDWAAQGF